MLIAMVSLAGVPFTAGFFGKFLIFNAAVQHHQTALIVVGVITVACGFYYYLKVVRAMYWEDATSAEPISITGLSAYGHDTPDGRNRLALSGADLECVGPQPILIRVTVTA